MMAKQKPESPASANVGTTRVRLDVTDAEHRHLRMAAAEANMSMAAYARRLVQEDMKRKGKPSE